MKSEGLLIENKYSEMPVIDLEAPVIFYTINAPAAERSEQTLRFKGA
jgi:hypothetical protein